MLLLKQIRHCAIAEYISSIISMRTNGCFMGDKKPIYHQLLS